MVKSYTKILRLKLIVRVLTLVLLLNVSNSWGQATLPLARTTWGGAEPAGWTNSGCTQRITTFACTGSDGTIFDTNGDSRTVFFGSAPNQLVFKLKTGTMSGETSLLVQESPDGSLWTNIGNYGTATGATTITDCSNISITLNCLSRYVKWTYTKVTGNCDMDDVSISSFSGTCCTAPTTTLSTTSQTLCTNTATSFSVGTSATNPTYAWEMSANNSTWTPVSNGTPTGASYAASTLATLSYTTGTSATTYYYHCLVTENGTCTATSNSNSVTVNMSPTITSQPSNTTICTGNNVTFNTVVSGSPLVYQWQEKVGAGAFANITNGGVYSGATTNALTLTNPPIGMSTNQYQCIISVASCSSATTTAAILTIVSTPAAPPTPTAVANPACGGTLLIAMTSTVGGVTWYWTGQTGSGTSTLSPTSSDYYVGESDTYYVRAKINGSSCWSATTSIVVTINQAPIVTAQPTDVSICDPSNTSFAVTASNAAGYQWQVDNGTGFVNLTNVAPYSTVTTNALTITGATVGMNGYKYRCVVSGNSPCASVTSNFATLIVTASADPTTAATSPIVSSIGCNAFNLSFTKGNGSNRLVVVKAVSAVAGSPADGTNYTSSTIFGSGGTIAAGEFVVYKGTGSSVFITGLTASTTYYYKVFEYNGCGFNYLTSGIVPTGSVTTTSCSAAAGITAVYIDACGSGVCPHEGSNELVWGESGSYGMAVNNNGPSLHYDGATPTPTTTYISTYSQNASNISALNTAVGACTTTTFVDPNTQGYIPPNSNFLIANNCMCSPSVYDFSGLCGTGPIYVVFGTNTAWPCNTTGGIFGNKSCTGTGVNPRYFDLNFTAWGVATPSPIYNYTPCALTGGVDGDIVITSHPAAGASTYSNTGCTVPLIVLPIELVDFYATKNGNINDVVWKVASEINVVYYTIGKSDDGINFTELGSVYSTNSTQVKSYTIVDDTPFDNITYYRLGTKENDGSVIYHKIISVDQKSTSWNCYNYQQEQNLVIEFKNYVPKNSMLNLYDLSGKLLVEEVIKGSQTKINTQNFTQGIYFLKIATPYKTENFKIIITK